MYKLLFSILFRHLPAEAAHRVGFALIRGAALLPGVCWLQRRLLVPRDPVLHVHALGRDLAGPLGLAAGFDKDAVAAHALGALGFAFVEVGTLTAQPQPGNPKPRLFRLPADHALVNRMGFNNSGAAAAAARLRRRSQHDLHDDAGRMVARESGPGPGLRSRSRFRWRSRPGIRLMVGANIGKTKVVPASAAAADYAASARLLAPEADYLVLNVSSPNTPGLRGLQAVNQLRELITTVQKAAHVADRPMPLLVKIAPDLSDEEVDGIADLALELGLAGIIATNTTLGRDGLTSPRTEIAAAGAGGLSGAPLAPRAGHVLRRLRARVGDRLVLVAVGGIQTPDDAWERIQDGATLLQGYTGFVFGGPLWPTRIHRGLARRVRAAGFTSIQQAVGTSAPPLPPPNPQLAATARWCLGVPGLVLALGEPIIGGCARRTAGVKT